MTARWFVLGLGNAGLTLAAALDSRGLLAGASTRSEARAVAAARSLSCSIEQTMLPCFDTLSPGDAVLVAVPDDILPRLSAALTFPNDVAVVHCSGVHGADVLPALLGDRRGASHPLMSLGGPRDVARLQGAFFALDGVGSGFDAAASLASQCGGIAERVGADARTAYHAAAVLAGNGVFGLLHAARSACASVGLTGEALHTGLSTLASASAERAGGRSIAAVATGPVARNDGATLSRHLEALARLRPELVALYLETQRALLAALDESDHGTHMAAHHALTEPDRAPDGE